MVYVCAARNGTRSRLEWLSSNPCTRYRRDSLLTHSRSRQHIDALNAAMLKMNATEKGAINVIHAGFNTVEKANARAVQARLRILYFLVKQKRPLNDFKSTLQLCADLNCPALPLQSSGGHENGINYCSPRFVREALKAVSDEVEDIQLTKMKASPVLAFLIDEARDVSNHEDMLVYVRFFNVITGKPETGFLSCARLENGTAETITETLRQEVIKRQLELQKGVSFTSDGAGVMLGSKTGVGVQWKELAKMSLHIWCLSHRLALGARYQIT